LAPPPPSPPQADPPSATPSTSAEIKGCFEDKRDVIDMARMLPERGARGSRDARALPPDIAKRARYIAKDARDDGPRVAGFGISGQRARRAPAHVGRRNKRRGLR